jgi:hypothetical protein
MEISFNYVATFVSLIYGLSIAHALTCIAEYLQNYKQINLEDNAKGIYFLEIETNDGVINKKLILQ